MKIRHADGAEWVISDSDSLREFLIDLESIEFENENEYAKIRVCTLEEPSIESLTENLDEPRKELITAWFNNLVAKNRLREANEIHSEAMINFICAKEKSSKEDLEFLESFLK